MLGCGFILFIYYAAAEAGLGEWDESALNAGPSSQWLSPHGGAGKSMGLGSDERRFDPCSGTHWLQDLGKLPELSLCVSVYKMRLKEIYTSWVVLGGA